jgi:hypothetical protein
MDLNEKTHWCEAPKWHDSLPDGYCGRPAYGKVDHGRWYGWSCPEHKGPQKPGLKTDKVTNTGKESTPCNSHTVTT